MNQQRVVLVTGGMGGLGETISTKMVDAGYRLAVTYSPGNKTHAEWVAQMMDRGYDILAVPCDVADFDSCRSAVEDVQATLGPVDVLVNNAGIMKLATVAESDDALFDSIMRINVKGSFNTMREAARRLRDGGRIINLSSSLVGLLMPTYGVYAASKAAVEAMTHVLMKEVRGRNITVNAVAPGPTATELFLDGKSPELIDKMAKMAPLERLGKPEDIANAVAFLAGADGSWINGQTLRANGGII